MFRFRDPFKIVSEFFGRPVLVHQSLVHLFPHVGGGESFDEGVLGIASNCVDSVPKHSFFVACSPRSSAGWCVLCSPVTWLCVPMIMSDSHYLEVVLEVVSLGWSSCLSGETWGLVLLPLLSLQELCWGCCCCRVT